MPRVMPKLSRNAQVAVTRAASASVSGARTAQQHLGLIDLHLLLRPSERLFTKRSKTFHLGTD